MQWTDGYYTGTEYTSGYYPNLAPDHLRFVCQAAGVRCRIPDQPTYLELGFGRGVSVNIHAAANAGVFWGVDFNPAHVAHAERLAEASGADVVLSEEGFADFCVRPDLPMFDVIALHGVWSWISEANRRTILDLIRLRLRPGGVAYVSYNAQPGWSALAPVRHLLELGRDRAVGAAVGADDPGGVERALDFLQDVVGASPRYFAEVKPAATLASGLPKKSRTYLAHEYLNADWHIPWFAEVAAGMAEAKLSFVASAQGGLGGPPWQDVDAYRQTSPYLRADRVTAPLLLLTADLDFVAPTQAEQMFSALSRSGKTARLVTFWGEHHHAWSPANIRERYRLILDWLDQTLPDPDVTVPASGGPPTPAPSSRRPPPP